MLATSLGRSSTTANQIRLLAYRHRAAGTLLDKSIADILEEAADDLDYTGTETWAEHKARIAVLTEDDDRPR